MLSDEPTLDSPTPFSWRRLVIVLAQTNLYLSFVRMYRIGEFAVRIERSASTVRRWEREGRIAAKRTPTGQRCFDESDVRAALRPSFDAAERATVVYCRVSSPGQKDDLASQVAAMETFRLGAGIAVIEHIVQRNGCELIVANSESLSPKKEFVKDLLAIVHSFSCRLYRLHRYEKQLEQESKGDNE